MQEGSRQQNELVSMPSESFSSTSLLFSEQKNKTPHHVLLSADNVFAAIRELNEDPPRLEHLREVLKQLTQLSTIATTTTEELSDKESTSLCSSLDVWMECNGNEIVTELLHVLRQKINNVARCKASMLNVTWKFLTLLLTSPQMTFRCYYEGMRYMLECLELQVNSVISVIHRTSKCHMEQQEYKKNSINCKANGRNKNKKLEDNNEMTRESNKANSGTVQNIDGAIKLTAFCASHILSVIRASSSRYLCEINTCYEQDYNGFNTADAQTARESRSIASEIHNSINKSVEVTNEDFSSRTENRLLKLIVSKYLNILDLIATSPQSAPLHELFSVTMSRFAASYNLIGSCFAEYAVNKEGPLKTLCSIVRFTHCWSETKEEQQCEFEDEQEQLREELQHRSNNTKQLVKPCANSENTDQNEKILLRHMISALGCFHCSLSFIDGCTSKLNNLLDKELHSSFSSFPSPSSTPSSTAATTSNSSFPMLKLSCASIKHTAKKEKVLERWQHMYNLTNEFIAVMLHWVPHLSYFAQASVEPMLGTSWTDTHTRWSNSNEKEKEGISNTTIADNFIPNKDRNDNIEEHVNADQLEIEPLVQNNTTTSELNKFSVHSRQTLLEFIAKQALLLPHNTFTLCSSETANTISSDDHKTIRYNKESSQSLRNEWITLMSKLLLYNRCTHVCICKATHCDCTIVCNDDKWGSSTKNDVNNDTYKEYFGDDLTKQNDGLLMYISALCNPSSEHSLLLCDAWVEMLMLIKENKTPVWFSELSLFSTIPQTTFAETPNLMALDTNVRANVELSLSIIELLLRISQEVYNNNNNTINNCNSGSISSGSKNHDINKTELKRSVNAKHNCNENESENCNNGNKLEAIHEQNKETKSNILSREGEHTTDNNYNCKKVHTSDAHEHKVFNMWGYKYVAVLANLSAMSFRLLLHQPMLVQITVNSEIDNTSSHSNSNELCHKDDNGKHISTNEGVNSVQLQSFVSMFISQVALLSMFADNNEDNEMEMCHTTSKYNCAKEKQTTDQQIIWDVIAHHIVEQLHQCVNTLSRVNLSNKQTFTNEKNASKEEQHTDDNNIKRSNTNTSCELSTNSYTTLLHVVTVVLQTLHYLQSMRQLSKVINKWKELLEEEHSLQQTLSTSTSPVELLWCDRLLCEKWLGSVSLSVTRVFTSLTRVIVKFEALCRTKMHMAEFNNNTNCISVNDNITLNGIRNLNSQESKNINKNNKMQHQIRRCTMAQKWLGLLASCMVSELSAWQLCKPPIIISSSSTNNNTSAINNCSNTNVANTMVNNSDVDNEALIACTRRCIDYSFALMKNTDVELTSTNPHSKLDEYTEENHNNTSNDQKTKAVKIKESNNDKVLDHFNLFCATLHLLKFVENNADVAIEKLHLSDRAASCLMKLLCPLSDSFNDSNNNISKQNDSTEESVQQQEEPEEIEHEKQQQLTQTRQLFESIAKWQLQNYIEWWTSKLTQDKYEKCDNTLTHYENNLQQSDEEEVKLMLNSSAMPEVTNIKKFHKFLLEAIHNKLIANNKYELYWELERSIRCCAKEMCTVQEVFAKMKRSNLLKQEELLQCPYTEENHEEEELSKKELEVYCPEEQNQQQGQQQMQFTLDKGNSARNDEDVTKFNNYHSAHVFALRSTNLNTTNYKHNGATIAKKGSKRQREADFVNADNENVNVTNRCNVHTCNDEWQLDMNAIATELERLIATSSNTLLQLREIQERSFAYMQNA